MSKYGLKSMLKLPEQIVFGTNTIEELVDYSINFGKKVAFLYGGKSLKKSGNYDRIIKALNKNSIYVEKIGGITHDPDELLVKDYVNRVKDCNPDVIIGVGGGSVIDTAKAVSIIIPNGGEVRDYWEGKAFTKPSIPYIAVPTTSGTGSEVTKNAVITNVEKTSKKSIRSNYMIPNIALIDPSLTLGSPDSVTANTGLDALIQNLEGYTSKNSGPITDTFAMKGVELSSKHLLRAIEDPMDIEAREALSLSSLYGGITLANAGLGLAHGLSHPIGIKFGIPHGRACAIVMAKVIEYNYPKRKEKYDEVGMLLGGIPDAVEAFTRLMKKLGISTKLSDYGVKINDLPDIAARSKGGSRGYNPIDHSDETVIKMLKEIL